MFSWKMLSVMDLLHHASDSFISPKIKSLKMSKIRIILKQYNKSFYFEHLLSIGLFTSDNRFCNTFQADQRNPHSGCTWRLMWNMFSNGLGHLNFVQKMGVSNQQNCKDIRCNNVRKNKKKMN